MTRLYDWWFDKGNSGRYFLKGIVTGHPKLIDGHRIHTSYLESMTPDSKNHAEILIQTQNRVYFCSMADCHYGQCRKFFNHRSDTDQPPMGFEQWALALEEYAAQYEDTTPADDSSVEDGGYILVRLGNHKDYYFDSMTVCLEDGSQLNAQRWIHSGMFQDSVLCTAGELEEYDLRYFPYRDCNISFYRWDTGDLPVYLENTGDRELRVETVGGIYVLHPSERVLVDRYNSSPGVCLTSCKDLYGPDFTVDGIGT